MQDNNAPRKINKHLLSAVSRIKAYAIFSHAHSELIFFGTVALVYCIGYLGYHDTPGNNVLSCKGWNEWYDQGMYIKSAVALSKFQFDSSLHMFPIGYPFLASFFVNLMPTHIFFIPNLISVCASCYLLVKIFGKFVSDIEALLILTAFCFLTPANILCQSLIDPWNTIPTACLSYLLVYISLLDPTPARLYILSALLGAMFFIKPVDAFIVSPILVCFALSLKNIKEILVSASLGILIVAGFISCYILSNYLIHGSYLSWYEELNKKLGFFSYGFEQLYTSLFNSYPLFRNNHAIFIIFPWLYIVLPGFFYICKEYRKPGFGIIAALLLSYTMYLKYNVMWAYSTLSFAAIHFVFWTLPLLALCAYLAIFYAWRKLNKALYCFLFCIFFVALSSLNLNELPSGEWLLTMAGTNEQGKTIYSLNKTSPENANYKLIELNNPYEFIYSANMFRVSHDGAKDSLNYGKDFIIYPRADGLVIQFSRVRNDASYIVEFWGPLKSYSGPTHGQAYDLAWSYSLKLARMFKP